jgi:hypothetical protein
MLDEPTRAAPFDEIDEIEPDAEAPAAFWAPPDDVRHHNGDPLPLGLAFFAPPPDEIGEVVTAHSTLQAGKRPKSLVSRLLLALGLGSLVAVGVSYLDTTTPLWSILAFLAVAGLTMLLTRFSHHVSYVGKEGVARAWCLGSPRRIKKTEVFLFRDADELRTGQTRQYTNGVYTGTSYTFTWTDAGGRKRYRLSGTYHGEKKPPKPKDPYHFAHRAEVAWSFFLFDRAGRALEQEGAIRFNLGGASWLALGPGFVDIGRKEGVERWTLDEIGGITAKDGTFKIKRKDAKEGWFSSQGVFSFPYAQMANAQLFLIAMERLLGPTF